MKRLVGLPSLWKGLSASRRGVVIISMPVACLLSSVGMLAWLNVSMAGYERWIQHTQQVRLETSALLNNLADAETSVRGYRLTRHPESLQDYNVAIAQIPQSIDELEELVQDNPSQLRRLAEIEALVTRRLQRLEEKLLLDFGSAQQSGPAADSPETLSIEKLSTSRQEAKAAAAKMRKAINTFGEEEEQLLSDRQQRLDRYRLLNSLVLTLSVLTGVIGGAFAIHLFLQLHCELSMREAKLKAANAELEQAYDNLERFTANASHELRAPIAAVLSNAQVALMAAQSDPSQPQQRLKKIVALTKSMSSLVNDLLLLARDGDIVNQRSLHPFDLRSVLLPLTQDWQTHNSKPLQLSCHLPEQPVIVRGDTDLIRQVVTNLLSNANRYTPAGGKVKVSLMATDTDAIVEVADSGIGISPAALPYIFERFYRENSTRLDRAGGFGLGLAIAQQIVQAHQGRLSVVSEVGKGSTFRVALPLAVPQAE